MIKVKSIEFPGYYHSIAVISTRFSGKETTIKTEKNMYGNGCIIQGVQKEETPAPITLTARLMIQSHILLKWKQF